jgi:CPA2 family monovalent cation:H+ antiporter-2
LAQAGEFGFVLLTLAQKNELVPRALLNPILASMVISMLLTPFLVMYSNKIVMKLVSSDWMQQSLQMTGIARKAMGANKHVIICGYGRCGQNLARLTSTLTAYTKLQLPVIKSSMEMQYVCRL